MASAAAVATDVSRSPIPEREVNDALDTVGGITSADAEDDSSDDVQNGLTNGHASPPSKHKVASTPEDVDDDAALFGSGSEDERSADGISLDDELLDSGDDEDRDDRRHRGRSDAELALPLREEQALDVDLGRAPIPEPTDGEMYLLKMPPFLGIEPVQFQQAAFKPPTTDHHSKTQASSTFSTYNTAISTIRWRRSPSKPTDLQSNARVVRWSDGSLTLQFASRPGTHYPVAANALAPPQTNSKMPSPTSTSSKTRSHTSKYNPIQDTFTYLAAPQELAGILRLTNKITVGLKVQSATDAAAEALERLQNSLAAAATGSQDDQPNHIGGINMVRITEDPELAKKKAELAEKEKMKASRRREAQELRDRERHGRVLGRRGVGGGLTVGDLEGEDEGFTRLPGLGGRKSRPPKSNRHGEIYSDDESDYVGRRKTREDEYDAEDDFLAPSDEEEEEVQGEDDSDEIETNHARSRVSAPRQGTPKRSFHEAEGDLDEDDEVRPTAGSPVARGKRRRVIEEDEE